MCAAAFSAVSTGYQSIDYLVLVSKGRTLSYPFGTYRQVLHEYNPLKWSGVESLGSVSNLATLAELFAYLFGPEDLR